MLLSIANVNVSIRKGRLHAKDAKVEAKSEFPTYRNGEEGWDTCLVSLCHLKPKRETDLSLTSVLRWKSIKYVDISVRGTQHLRQLCTQIFLPQSGTKD